MQLKLSIAAATLLASSLYSQDFVRVQYLQYNETDDRVEVKAPSLEVNKDFGLDYTLNFKAVADAVSGGTPILTDTSSGASAFSRNESTNKNNIKKQNVDFDESRSYLALSLLTRFEKSRNELNTSISRSYESDYESLNLSLDYLIWADETKNRSYNIGLAVQKNEILLKNGSSEQHDDDDDDDDDHDSESGASAKEDSTLFTTEFGITQVLNKKSLIKTSVYYTKEDGYLTNPYFNVAKDNYTKLVEENRPDTRDSYGFNLKYFKSVNSKFDYNIKYKFYSDDWDITSHTVDLNSYYKFASKWTLGLGARYYTQSEAKFFKDTSFDNNEKYASSDDRLSSFNAITFKTNLDYKYSKSFEYNIGYNLYEQSTDLSASYFTVGMKYNF